MAGFLSRLLTLGEGKQLKNYEALVQKVNALEGGMQAKSDAELAALTAAFRERADNGEDLKSLLPEAFAAVREASVRTLGLDVYKRQVLEHVLLALVKDPVELLSAQALCCHSTSPPSFGSGARI